LVWSHKGNKVATNGSALLLVGVPTPDQFSNWSIRSDKTSCELSRRFVNGENRSDGVTLGDFLALTLPSGFAANRRLTPLTKRRYTPDNRSGLLISVRPPSWTAYVQPKLSHWLGINVIPENEGSNMPHNGKSLICFVKIHSKDTSGNNVAITLKSDNATP